MAILAIIAVLAVILGINLLYVQRCIKKWDETQHDSMEEK